VTIASIYMPRKNAKSSMTAPAAIFGANCEGEVGASVVITAGSEKQAGKIYGPCRTILEMAPAIRAQWGAKDSRNEIEFKKTGGSIRPLATKAENNDGENPHMVIAEELHAQDFDNIGVLRTAQGAREAPLFMAISTAGRTPHGQAYDDWLLCIAVLEGRQTAPRMFCFIATVDKDDEKNAPYDVATICKANPMYGVSLRPQKIEDEIRDARRSESARVEYLRTRLNIWSRAGGRLIPMDSWDACEDPKLDLRLFKNFPCYVAGDLASRNDLCAVVFMVDVANALYVTPRFWICENSWRFSDDRYSDDFVTWARTGPLGAWTKGGKGRPWLTVTPGDFVDYRTILDDTMDMIDGFDNVIGVGLDDYQANLFGSDVERHGYSCFIVPKNAKNLTLPTNDIIGRVGAPDMLYHDGNPILTWCSGNVVGHWDANDNVLPRKEVKGGRTASIDGFDALVIANAVRMADKAGVLNNRQGGAKPRPKLYTERGLLGAGEDESNAGRTPWRNREGG
jgi:phage terminase large subunit-like protein